MTLLKDFQILNLGNSFLSSILSWTEAQFINPFIYFAFFIIFLLSCETKSLFVKSQ